MWRQHGASHPARYDATLRLLARLRGAVVRLDYGGSRNSELCVLCAGSYATGSVPVLRVPNYMPWRMRRATASRRSTIAAGFLLSDHPGRAPATQNSHG